MAGWFNELLGVIWKEIVHLSCPLIMCTIRKAFCIMMLAHVTAHLSTGSLFCPLIRRIFHSIADLVTVPRGGVLYNQLNSKFILRTIPADISWVLVPMRSTAPGNNVPSLPLLIYISSQWRYACIFGRRGDGRSSNYPNPPMHTPITFSGIQNQKGWNLDLGRSSGSLPVRGYPIELHAIMHAYLGRKTVGDCTTMISQGES